MFLERIQNKRPRISREKNPMLLRNESQKHLDQNKGTFYFTRREIGKRLFDFLFLRFHGIHIRAQIGGTVLGFTQNSLPDDIFLFRRCLSLYFRNQSNPLFTRKTDLTIKIRQICHGDIPLPRLCQSCRHGLFIGKLKFANIIDGYSIF